MSAPKKARIEERVAGEDAAPEGPEEAADLGAEDNQEYYDEAYAKEEEEEEIADQAAQAEAYDELEALQRQLMEVNDEASDKVLQIEVEYNQKRQPIYRERSKYFKRLPHFWMRVLTQQSNLHELIVGEDIDALCYCEDVVVEDAPDIKSGYSIIFHFGENPYFSNATLEKHYAYHDDGTAEITSAAPDWYPGHSLVEDPQGPEVLVNGRMRRARDSFFLWFEEIVLRGEASSADDPVADIIKEQIWPNPLALYQEASEDLAGDADNPIVLDDGDEAQDGYAYGVQGEEGAAEDEEGYYEEGAEGEEALEPGEGEQLHAGEGGEEEGAEEGGAEEAAAE